MKDLVIGCITGYTFDKIKVWCNSLERSGFDGYKAVIVYNVPYSTVTELESRGYIVIKFDKDDKLQQYTYGQDFIITVERHLHSHLLLKEFEKDGIDIRYVIATDPRDVIFQKNPSIWLEQNLHDKKINVGCESIKYKDEEWGRQNLYESFGENIYDLCKENLIFNAGTIAGDFQYMKDFFLNIYVTALGSPNKTPDQAALNILLSLKPYKDITNFAMSEDSWACQAGTVADPLRCIKYSTYLTEPTPKLSGDVITTSTGTEFTLVHQYDRVPEWKTILENKYA